MRAVETLHRLPEVSGVAAAYNLPYEGSSGNNVYIPEGDRELFNIADQYEVSSGFYDLMGIKMLEGRAPENENEIAVDDKFVAKMAEFVDWSDGAIGKQLFITGHSRGRSAENSNFTISGIYQSYLIGNLKWVDERPSALFYGEIGSMDYWMKHIMFRMENPAAKETVLTALTEALEDKEIDIVSYEEQMRANHADSQKMRNTLILGAIFSLIIALLGLIGFIRDESLRRSKEMAVRKINGATTREIISIFIADILKLSVVMAVLADIAAFFVARIWQEQFAQKASLGLWVFLLADILVLAIVVAVVAFNSLKIARENPVVALKME